MSISIRPVRPRGAGLLPAAAACSLFGTAGLGPALPVLAALATFAALGASTAHAQSSQAAPVVYRCPGPPVLYTDTLTPQEARSKNCKPLTDLPVAVAPPSLPRAQPQATPAPAAAAAAPSVGTASAGTANAPSVGVMPPPGGTRVTVGSSGAAAATSTPGTTAGSPPTSGTSSVAAVAAAVPDARVRPDDQRSRDAEARRILEAELRREEARLSDALKASGTAKPGERVGTDAAQIRRAESDIEAIRRELGRLR